MNTYEQMYLNLIGNLWWIQEDLPSDTQGYIWIELQTVEERNTDTLK